MLDNITSIFDDMKNKLKHLKKKSYETNMAEFQKTHGHYFEEMTNRIDTAENKEAAAMEMANLFVDEVAEKYASGKKKQIPQYIQVDLNFFMIYYVFPALLKTEHEDAKLIADSICEEWGKRFKESKIGYTDYETLYNSFREKIFGIF